MKTPPQRIVSAKSAHESKNQTLKLKEEKDTARKRVVAEFCLSGIITNANTALAFSKTPFGEVGLLEAIDVMKETAGKALAGDLSDIEARLASQAVALDIMFTELARRAAVNMGTHLGATETYLRLALKAQGQSRATMQTLAEVKYPKTATFVGQQNNAYQQQVNNGGVSGLPSSDTRVSEKNNSTNELLNGGGK